MPKPPSPPSETRANRVLRAIEKATADPDVRQWLEALLLRGESAQSPEVTTERPRAGS
jgi:hypothetical protein